MEKRMLVSVVSVTVVAGLVLAAQDKYTVKVPGGSRSPNSEVTKHGRPLPSVETKR
jgi:hypothetical protein